MGHDRSVRMARLGGFVVLRRDDRVLLALGDYGRKLWGLPGGLVEEGESAEQAAVRETREETGYDVELGGLVAVSDPGRIVLQIFAATIVGGVERPEPGEIAELRWVDDAGLDEIAGETWAMAQTVARQALSEDLPPLRSVPAMGPGGGNDLWIT